MKQYNNAKLALMKTLLFIVVIIMVSCSMLIGCSNNSKNAEKQIACIRMTQRCGNKEWILSDKDAKRRFFLSILVVTGTNML